MAADTVGLLDHARDRAAHVVGASMGGMIAQTAGDRASRAGRARSDSIMSTTGNRRVPVQPTLAVFALMLPAAARPRGLIERR